MGKRADDEATGKLLQIQGPTEVDWQRASIVKNEITREVGTCLKVLQNDYSNTESPVESSSDSANKLCYALEAVFLHQLKKSVSSKLTRLIANRNSTDNDMTFWGFLVRFTHKDTVVQLNHLGQITTEVGMCRAWIRLALNDGVLESYLDAISSDVTSVKSFYTRLSYLRDSEQFGILKSYIQGLTNVQFRLSYNASTLNVWTKQPLVLCGVVTPAPSILPVIASETPETASRQKRSVSVRETASLSVPPSDTHPGSRTPPNTPLDGNLTRSDIEDIRRRAQRVAADADGSSTSTSQISHPDPGPPSTSPGDLVTARRSAPWPSDHVITEYDSDTAIIDTASPHHGSEPAGNADIPIARRRRKKKRQCHAESLSDTSTTPSDPAVIGGQTVCGNITYPSVTTDRNTNITCTTELISETVPDTAGNEDQNVSAHNMDDEHVEDDLQVVEDAVVTLLEDVAVETSEPEQGLSVTRTSEAPVDKESDTEQAPADIRTDKNCNLTAGDMEKTSHDVSLAETRNNVTSSDAADMYARASEQISEEISEAIADEVISEVNDTEESIYDWGQQSNSLGIGVMQGWSSEFEPQSAKSPKLVKRVRQGSETVFKKYMLHTDSAVNSSKTSQDESGDGRRDSTTPDTEYEVLSLDDDTLAECTVTNVDERRAAIGQISNEKGLFAQNYQCYGCESPIGIIYGRERVCTYDGKCYCSSCHENDEYYIPSYIAINWDYRKHKVCKQNLVFLRQSEEEALINLEVVNSRLYAHVPEMAEIRELRLQLRYLKAYLFTCKKSVAEDLRRRVWPRDYLYDNIHRYSLSDFLQIPSGNLAASLRKLIKFCQTHVYDCRLCSQKGYICEICDSPKVIYPFERPTTSRCDVCHSVYHLACRSVADPCPRCIRRMERRHSSLPSREETHSLDYTCDPDPHHPPQGDPDHHPPEGDPDHHPPEGDCDPGHHHPPEGDRDSAAEQTVLR